jgi:DNA modification methylase
MDPKSMKVDYASHSSLKPTRRNARKHSRRQIRQIAQSIKAFGFNVPILTDDAGNIIAGHGRYEAAELLGWTEVPTIRLEHLNEAQKRAFMIADNRLTENAEWDEKLLAIELKELSNLDLDFELETTGFEIAEIDLRIEGLSDRENESDPADIVPIAARGSPVTRPGDQWVLRRHRILCADSTQSGSYAAVMGAAKAAMVFTDPPFNVPIDGHVSGLGAIRHREFAMASGEMSSAEFTGFLTHFARLCTQHSFNGALHFICMDWRHAGDLLAAGEQVYSELKNICVWVKHNAGMGSFYRSQHELIFVFKYGKKPHRNNIELGRFGRNRTNVWNHPGANTLGRVGEEGHLLALHPTVKPVSMVADAILDCTKRGDVVLDPFLGSGTTLLAAERTGRTCRGMEVDPLYVDTAVRRWQAFTGEDATHAVTSQTFTEIEKSGGPGNV